MTHCCPGCSRHAERVVSLPSHDTLFTLICSVSWVGWSGRPCHDNSAPLKKNAYYYTSSVHCRSKFYSIKNVLVGWMHTNIVQFQYSLFCFLHLLATCIPNSFLSVCFPGYKRLSSAVTDWLMFSLLTDSFIFGNNCKSHWTKLDGTVMWEHLSNIPSEKKFNSIVHSTLMLLLMVQMNWYLHW